jgi:hypothetical protein
MFNRAEQALVILGGCQRIWLAACGMLLPSNLTGDKMTREEAVAKFDSKFWETMSYAERAKFQISEERLCMPFDVFQEAVEKHLDRPVFTHEFGLNREGLIKEINAKD